MELNLYFQISRQMPQWASVLGYFYKDSKEGALVEVTLKKPFYELVLVVVVYAWRQWLNCLRRTPSYFTLIGDKAPPAARGSSEVARA